MARPYVDSCGDFKVSSLARRTRPRPHEAVARCRGIKSTHGATILQHRGTLPARTTLHVARGTSSCGPAETGQVFIDDVKAAAFEFTRSQPWLVNALARQLIDTVVPDRAQDITGDHLLVTKEILIRRRETDLDSLLDRLGVGDLQAAVELKVRRNRSGDPLQAGLGQLSDYLDRLELPTGTLILFDLRTDAPPMDERCSRETEEHRGAPRTEADGVEVVRPSGKSPSRGAHPSRIG